jgi:CRP-like cAMP-binding protein
MSVAIGRLCFAFRGQLCAPSIPQNILVRNKTIIGEAHAFLNPGRRFYSSTLVRNKTIIGKAHAFLNPGRRFYSSTLVRNKTIFDKASASFAPKIPQKIDWGTVVMNVGAVSGLCGFMMSDVLYLRILSICGSLCGVGYNITRTPRQINACLWGGVFITTNLFMIVQLIQERNAEGPKFNIHELHLWQRHFKEYGVDARTFQKMIAKSSWKTYARGDEIVAAGLPLDEVLVIHEGEACAYKTDYDKEGELQFKQEMYRYEGRGRNGCIVGGTALVDPRPSHGSYPHSVVSEMDDTMVVSWDREELKQMMKENPLVESALIHTMYIDLITGLRRQQGEVFENKSIVGKAKEEGAAIKMEQDDSVDDGMVEGKEEEWNKAITLKGSYNKQLEVRRMLRTYLHLLEDAIEPEKGLVLDPQRKRIARKFAFHKGVSLAQHVIAVHSLGWSRHEWQDGIKEENEKNISPTVRKLRHSLTKRKRLALEVEEVEEKKK